MSITIILPKRLVESVSARLAMLPQQTTVIRLHEVESPAPLPAFLQGDGLLALQANDMAMACQMAASASAAHIHYGEIALLETPLAAQYGFMVAAAGQAQDLQMLSPVINCLSPAPYAWWHVGHAGAAAFLSALLRQMESAMQRPIDPSAPLPQLIQLAALQSQAGILAESFLAQTEGEHFVCALPNRQHALASFLDGAESPARQIARMISQLAQIATGIAAVGHVQPQDPASRAGNHGT